MPRGAVAIIDSIGMEYESEVVIDYVAQNVFPREWMIDHDASVQTDMSTSVIGPISSYPKGLNLRADRVVVGTELVLRNPLEDTAFSSAVYSLVSGLKNLGEQGQAFRSGIHYHIALPHNLTLLKNTLKLGASLEDVFFNVGGQGYTFRGMLKNESLYCRPITKWGPQVVTALNTSSGSQRYAQVFTIDDLLAAESLDTFWRRLGLNWKAELPRYFPGRYCWLNFYSIIYHGSLEFRNFNVTLNSERIVAEAKMCQAFCKKVLGSLYTKCFEPEEHSIYNKRSKSEMERDLVDLCSNGGMSKKEIDTLVHSLWTTPEIKIPESYIKTHLERQSAIDVSGATQVTNLPSDTPVKFLRVDDIHLRRGEHG